MRQPILTPEQEREYEGVKAEAAAMEATATLSERFAMTCKLSMYAHGAQHLGPEEHSIMARWPAVRHTTPETGDEDDLFV